VKKVFPELTIVIPAKNEDKYIGLLLQSLISQDYPAMAETRILVADAQSTDNTRAIVESFRDRLNLEIIEGGLPSIGRNRGAELADTPYVLFVDADIIVRPYLVSRSLEYLKHQGWHAVTANVLCKSGIFLDEWFLFTVNTLGRLLGFGTGMFLLFDREKFWELGGFDPRIVYAEDIHLTLQLGRKRFGYVPGYVLTDNRRFRKMGYGSVAWLWLRTLGNLFNNRFYYRDHRSYWDHRVSE
jgi:glycosyltransferase involved in cell wall biosynthesis